MRDGYSQLGVKMVAVDWVGGSLMEFGDFQPDLRAPVNLPSPSAWNWFRLDKPNCIPPDDLRELRVLARYRQKLAQTLVDEKNRMHEVLDAANIQRGTVLSDLPRS